MRERMRFAVSFGVIVVVMLWANVEVLMRSGEVLACTGTQGTTQFQCARWRTIGLFVSVLALFYPLGYLADMEAARDVFAK